MQCCAVHCTAVQCITFGCLGECRSAAPVAGALQGRCRHCGTLLYTLLYSILYCTLYTALYCTIYTTLYYTLYTALYCTLYTTLYYTLYTVESSPGQDIVHGLSGNGCGFFRWSHDLCSSWLAGWVCTWEQTGWKCDTLTLANWNSF